MLKYLLGLCAEVVTFLFCDDLFFSDSIRLMMDLVLREYFPEARSLMHIFMFVVFDWSGSLDLESLKNFTTHVFCTFSD